MFNFQTNHNFNKAFSLVEVMLASAVFALMAAAFVGAYLYGQEATVLAGNKARAVMYAEEGLEATRNIRDAAFANLVDGTYGLATTSNQWSFSGASDTNDIYTRAIAIMSLDAFTKIVTSTVTWQQNLQRNGTIALTTYFSNWQRITTNYGSALVIYGDGSTLPKYRTYATSTNTYSTALPTVTSTAGLTFALDTSPTKKEAIAGFITSAGVLNIMCFDGATWTTDFTVTVGGTGTDRRFDVAYEHTTGDAMVLYSTNVATTNELAYRTKLGSTGCGSANWSAGTNLNPARTAGIVQWVKMSADKRDGQNNIGAIWADAASDLSAIIWDGTAWVNEPATATETSLEIVTVAQDVEDFDLEYESLSGDLMVVWANSAGGNNVNGVRYRLCTGGLATCTWGAVTTPPTFADDATNLDLSANPLSDEMVFASVGNASSDLQTGYWNGSAWTNTANRDTSTGAPLAGTRLVATAWLTNGATTRSIVAYNDSGSTNIGYYAGSAGTFTAQADFTPTPAFANPQKYYYLETNPLDKSQLMFIVSDNNNDLFAKRLVMSAVPAYTWTNADGGAALTLTLGQSTRNPYAFAYWKQ